jgi:flagellin-like protein
MDRWDLAGRGRNHGPGGGGRWLAERGLSPVVGAALLIGIVVILASVIGTFVLGFDTGSPAPDVTFRLEDTRVNSVTDNQSNTWSDVLAVEITHRGGEPVPREQLVIKHKPEIGTSVTGYALDIDQEDNVTDPRWNRIDSDGTQVQGGDTTRYLLYMTPRIGSDGGFGEDTVSAAWETDRCTVERFGEPRLTADRPFGVMNFSSSGAASSNCPAPPGGYNVTSPKTDQAGRIRANDETLVIWQADDEKSSQLARHEVRDPT